MSHVVLLCVSLLVILYAVLSLNVSMTRLKKRKDSSVSEAALTKAIRAHGNASEYIPLFVAVLLYLNMGNPSSYIGVIAITALASRAMHAAGMFLIPTVNERHPLRFVGALGTYFCLFALGIALFQHGLKV